MCNCNYKCNCSSNSIVSKQVVLNNNTIGRDGEDAYDAYVRAGGTQTFEEWALSNETNKYGTDNW